MEAGAYWENGDLVEVFTMPGYDRTIKRITTFNNGVGYCVIKGYESGTWKNVKRILQFLSGYITKPINYVSDLLYTYSTITCGAWLGSVINKPPFTDNGIAQTGVFIYVPGLYGYGEPYGFVIAVRCFGGNEAFINSIWGVGSGGGWTGWKRLIQDL